MKDGLNSKSFQFLNLGGNIMANKNAKYRVQNEGGEFEVIHFETNMGQVQGLNDAMDLKADQADVDSSFRDLDGEITKIEGIASGLSGRIDAAEAANSKNERDLQTEVSRATEKEGQLEERLVQAETTLRDTVGAGLEELKKQVEANKSGISEEQKRAEEEEAKITQALGTKVSQDDFNAEQIRVNKALADKATQVSLDEAKADFERKIKEKADSEKVVQDIAASLVEANAYTDEKKAEADQHAQQLVDALEERVDGIDTRVGNNEGEIAKLKVAVSNKNSNTQVFANMDEFTRAAAGLQPKKGDLAYVLDIKKAYIYNELNVIVLNGVQPPAGWVLFDEISTEADLKDYIKSTEVAEKIQKVEANLNKEVERAQAKEGEIEGKVDTNIAGIATERSEREEAIRGAESNLEEVGQRLNDKIDAGLPTIGNSQPMGKGTNHIWIEMEV